MKLITSLLAAAAISVASFAVPAFAQDKGMVGISMPTKTSTRWISDGETMEKLFQDAGYTPDLQFADDDIPNQLAQIENMVTKGAKVLVIAAIDGTTLSDILQRSADAGVKVIAYDRLIRDSGNVDYYATFDNFQVGVLQATSLVDGLKAKFPDTKPWNVELFGGSPDDNNAFFFYDGAMSVLQPMIDSGDIVVKSGQMGMETVGTLRWDGAVAQARMENLLSSTYTDGRVDIIGRQQVRRDDLDAVVVGLGVVDLRRAARKGSVDQIGSDLGQFAGILEHGRVLLAGDDRLHGRDFGILTGDDRPAQVARAIAHAAQRRDDAAREAVIGGEHAVHDAAVRVVGRQDIVHAGLRHGAVPTERTDLVHAHLAGLDHDIAGIDHRLQHGHGAVI